MTLRDDAELLFDALTIRNETLDEANTAIRVGQMFVDIIDSKPNYDIYSIPLDPADNFKAAYALGGIIHFADELKITSTALIVNSIPIQGVANPSDPQDVATKAYVDAIAQGLQIKDPVRVSSTINLTLSGEQTIDGIAAVTGDRIIVRHQALPEENGLYLVDTGAWTRTTDGDIWDELINAFIFVEEGTAWAKTGWASQIDVIGTLGTDPVTFAQFSAAGNFTAGAGLTLIGSEFSISPIVANSVLLNATGSSAVPAGFALGANTFLARSASGNIGAKSIVEPFFGFAALTLGAADTVPQVNGAGTAIEYGKITSANIDPSAAITLTQLAAPTTLGVMLYAGAGPLWVETTTLKSDGTSLSFGADPATGGTLNFSDNSIAEAKRTGGTDAALWSWASDDLELGSNTIDNLVLNTGVGMSIFARIDNSTRLTITSALTTSANPIAIGSSPAATGAVRLTNNEFVTSITTGATTLNLLGLTSSNVLQLGTNSASLTSMTSNLGTGGAFGWNVAGTSVATLSATALTLPLGGTAATTGSIRVANNSNIVGKTAGGTDCNMLQMRTDDFVRVGSDSASPGVILDAQTSGEVRIRMNLGSEYRFFQTYASWEDNELRFGTNPSTGAKINVPNNVTIIEARNAANDADIAVAAVTSSNGLVFGMTAGAGLMAASIVNNVATSGTFDWRVNNTTEMNLSATTLDGNQNTLTDWESISLGTDPATAGAINLTNNTFIRQKSSGGTALQVFGLSSADRVTIGQNSSSIDGMDFAVGTGADFVWAIAGAAEMTLSATTLDGNQNSLTDWSFIELGSTTQPAAGLIRAGTTGIVLATRTSGGATAALIEWNFSSDNRVYWGDTDVAHHRFEVATSGAYVFAVNGSTEMTLNATTLDGAGNTLTNWASVAATFIALGADPADAGAVRLSNGTGNGINFEASPAGTDVEAMYLDTSEVLQLYNAEYSFSATTLDGNQNALTDWEYVALGTNPATSGAIRFTEGAQVLAKVFGGGSSAHVLRMFESASNTIILGGSTGVGNIDFGVSTGGTFDFDINGSTEYQFNSTTLDGQQNTLTDWASITLGSGTFGSGGLINVPHNVTIIAGANDVGTTRSLMRWGTTTNTLIFGDSNVEGGIVFDVESTGVHRFRFNGSDATTYQANYWDFLTAELRFNSTTATGGKLNTNNNVNFWNALTTGAATITLLNWGSGASNTLFIGATSGITRIRHDIATGGTYDWYVNNTVEYSFSATTFDGNQNSLSDWGFIELGTNPATSGGVRVANATYYVSRNAANDGNVFAIGVDGTNNIVIGHSTGSAANVIYNTLTSGTHDWRVNNSTEMVLSATTLDGNQNSLTDWSFIELGTAPVAGSGQVRLANAAIIAWRDSENTGNITGIQVDSGEQLLLGQSSGVMTHMLFHVPSTRTFEWRVNNVSEMVLTANTLDGQGNTLTNWASVATTFIAFGADPADAGAVRLSNGTGNGISFEASPASADVEAMYLDSSEVLQIYNGEYSFSSTTFDGNQNSLTDWSFIALGTDPASSGAVRLTNNDFINQKSSGGTTVLLIGMGASDRIAIGSSSSSVVGVDISAGSGAGTNSITFNSEGVQAALFDNVSFRLPLGGTAATTGSMRVATGFSLFGRDNGNANNRSLLNWTTGDNIIIGQNGVGIVEISATTEQRVVLNAATEYRFFSTHASWEDNELRFGTSPATGAKLNTTHAVTMWNGLLSAGSGGGTVNLIRWGTAADDVLQVGSSTMPQLRLESAGDTRIQLAGVLEYQFTTSTLDGNQNSLTDWQFITLGTTPAGAGAIRLTNNEPICYRNAANSADTIVMIMTSANDLLLGADTVVRDVLIRAADVRSIFFSMNGVTEYSMSQSTFDGNQNTLTDWASIALGAGTVGAGGLIGVPHGFSVLRGRDNGNTQNADLINWGATADKLFIGDAVVANMDLRIKTGGTFALVINGGNEYTFTSTGADWQGNSLTNVNIFSAEANDAIVLETAYLGSARRVTALNFGAAISTTQMPTNAGDLVTFMGNAGTPPSFTDSSAPVGGCVLWSEGGNFKFRGTSGITETLGATGSVTGAGAGYKTTARYIFNRSQTNSNTSFTHDIDLTSINGVDYASASKHATIYASVTITTLWSTSFSSEVNRYNCRIRNNAGTITVNATSDYSNSDPGSTASSVTISGTNLRIAKSGDSSGGNLNFLIVVELHCVRDA